MTKTFKKVPIKANKSKAATKKAPAKKAAKKKAKTFRKKDYDYNELLIDLRAEHYKTIIEKISPMIDQETRFVIGVSIVAGSKFRAYSIAMQEFLYLTKEYKSSKNDKLLSSYIDRLNSTEAMDHNLRHFNRIRINLLYDYSTNAAGLFAEAIKNLHNDLLHPYDYNEGASSKKSLNDFITTLSILVEQIWKGKGEALAVLYGR